MAAAAAAAAAADEEDEEFFLESGDATRVMVDVVEVFEEDDVAAAICASSSCSCCKAFTNAALSRFVCSALRAFFTLVVTQFSQITRTSLPLDPLSHFHVGVKSVEH